MLNFAGSPLSPADADESTPFSTTEEELEMSLRAAPVQNSHKGFKVSQPRAFVRKHPRMRLVLVSTDTDKVRAAKVGRA